MLLGLLREKSDLGRAFGPSVRSAIANDIERLAPPDDWVVVQKYSLASWPELLTLWIGLNGDLVRVIAHIPEEKRTTRVRVGVGAPITLEELIHRYVEHCVDLMEHFFRGCEDLAEKRNRRRDWIPAAEVGWFAW